MAIKTKIKSLNYQGKGIGFYNGKITFISNTIPGEEVEFKIINEKKNYANGKIVSFIVENKARAVVKCPYYLECGGCQLSHLKYENQLNYKEETLTQILKRNAGIEVIPRLIESSSKFNYRNKITLKIIDNKWGYYQEESHNFTHIINCELANNSINKIIENQNLFDITQGEIIIKANYLDEILIEIKTKEKANININKLLKMNIIGIVLNNQLLYGQDYFVQRVDDFNYRVNYDSFFQVNLEILKKVLQLLKTNKYHQVIDLYCGVGTLGMALQKEKLYGIELSGSAIKNAKKNNLLNNQNNKYMVGDSTKIKDIKEQIDAVIIDPPRSGINKETLKHLLNLKPQTIIYMSCNPLTLARDLNELKNYYQVNDTYLLDMFPQTYHIESLLILERKEEKLIDLHMHTHYSDGTDQVVEILQKCEEKKLSLISITDHDGVEAYFELEKINIKDYYSGEIITGAEYKTLYNNQAVEVIGYGIDPYQLRDLNKTIRENRNVNKQIRYLEHLMEIGKKLKLKFNDNLKIKESKFFASNVFIEEIFRYPENIAILKQHGVEKNFTSENFYRLALKNPESVFFAGDVSDYLPMREVIKKIQEAGGLAFLAHPLIYAFKNPLKETEKIIQEYSELDGIECYHNAFSEEETDSLIRLAKKYQKYISGGSDYHGERKTIELGRPKVDYYLCNWIEMPEKL